MTGDYFASHTASLILAWALCLPVFFWFVTNALVLLFDEVDGVPWMYSSLVGV